MKGITVNDDELYMIVEPGVTYGEAARYLASKHPDVVLPSVPPSVPTATVAVNYLEGGDGCGPGYASRFGSAFQTNEAFIMGMELVLPNGDIVRTGSWSRNDSASKFTFRKGHTIPLHELFVGAHGAFGVLTKMAIMLCPKPYDVIGRMYAVNKVEEGAELIHKITRKGVMSMGSLCSWIFAPMQRADLAPYPWEVTGGKTCLPDDYMKKWRDEIFPGCFPGAKSGLEGFYIITYQPVFDEFEKEAVEKTVEKAEKDWNLRRIDTDKMFIPAIEYFLKEGMARGFPGNTRARYLGWRGGGNMWPMLGQCGYKDYPKIHNAVVPIARKFGFEVAMHTFYHYGRTGHCRFIMPFNRMDPDECMRVAGATLEIINTCYELGLTNNRAFAIFTDLEWQRSVPGYVNLIKSIKRIVDPNGILNPASGING
jgi:FAD/FMN-containing dehydrogenase